MTIQTDTKAVSLDEQASKVRRAFEEMQRAAVPVTNEPCCLPYWVVEVYSDYIIVCENMGEYYQINYTLTADGVQFADKVEWAKVEKDWIEAKGLDVVTFYGDAVKSLGNGQVGGYLVRFSSPNAPDLAGDYFTPDTDFDLEWDEYGQAKSTVYFNHGLNPQLKKRKLAPATLKKDDFGIFAQTILDERDQYERFIYQQSAKNRMGWSSGVPSHLVERERVGGAYHIKHWPLGKDASITHIPAEPRNAALPIKSLPISDLQPDSDEPETPAENGQPLASAATSAGASEAVTENGSDQTQPVITIVSQPNGDNTMSELNEQGTQTPPVTPAQTPEQAEIKALSDKINVLLAHMEKTPAVMGSGYITQDGGRADQNIKSFGDFAMAIFRRDDVRLKTVYNAVKAIQEDQGQTGGYYVPPSFSAELVQAQTAISPLIALCRRFPVAQPSGDWPVLDIFSAPTAGSGNSALSAGLVSSTIAEGGAYTDRNVNFEIINWKVNKVGDRINVSDEMMADAPALDALLRQVITTHLSQKKERHILRGNGVGQPLGILNAPALINVTPGTNSAFTWIDVTTMLSRFRPSGDPSRIRWVMHRSLLPDLGNLQVASGSAATWVQNIGTDNPDMLPLMRYGIYFSEHLPQADSSGDALLVDFGSYGLWERGDIRIGFSEHAGWNTGEIVWRFDERYDGQPLARAAVTQADPTGSFTTSGFVNHND